MYFRFVKCFYLCINIIEEKYIFDITWNVYIYFYLKLFMYYKSKVICSIWRRKKQKQQQQLFWTPIKCRNTIKPTTSHTHTYTYIYIPRSVNFSRHQPNTPGVGVSGQVAMTLLLDFLPNKFMGVYILFIYKHRLLL